MIFKIYVPIYRLGIIFIFGSDRKASERWIKKQGFWGKDYVDEETLDWCFNDPHDGITCHNDKGHRLCVHVVDRNNHRTIAHEIYHAASRIMEWVGMYPSAANEEAYAYLIGFITEEVYNKLQDNGTRKQTIKSR